MSTPDAPPASPAPDAAPARRPPDRRRSIAIAAAIAVIAVAAVVIALVRGGGGTATTTTPGGGRVDAPASGRGDATFTDPTRGYRFTYPVAWTILDPAPDAVLQAGQGVTDAVAARAGESGSGTGFVAARIVFDPGTLGPGDTVDEAALDPVVRLLAPAKGPTVSADRGTIDGHPSLRYRLTSAAAAGGTALESEVTFVRRDDVVFQLTCQAPPKRFAAFRRQCAPVVESFRAG